MESFLKKLTFLLLTIVFHATNGISNHKRAHIPDCYVRAKDLPRAVPGRTIAYYLKTMARHASSTRTLQSCQSGAYNVQKEDFIQKLYVGSNTVARPVCGRYYSTGNYHHLEIAYKPLNCNKVV